VFYADKKVINKNYEDESSIYAKVKIVESEDMEAQIRQKF
jgi:hypothetical protein